MIINRVTFHDYRVYAGKQTIVLEPPASDKPVTLIGGLNGEGKTTLLEGIQIALYGRRSSVWQHNGTTYSEYLAQSIHRGADLGGGAMVEIEFEAVDQDVARRFRIQRSWKVVSTDKVVEYVQVFIDGELDRFLSEDWGDQVERFIPARLAELFFFDGEKIKHYADPQRLRELIERGVLSLLGIDLIDQLGLDLKALGAKITKSAKKAEPDTETEKLVAARDGLVAQKTVLSEQRAALVTAHDRKSEVRSAYDLEFEKQGGRLFAQRLQLESTQKQLQARRDDLEKSLVEVVSGPLPLKLVDTSLAICMVQMRIEAGVKGARAAFNRMQDQQKRVKRLLQQNEVAESTRKLLSEFYNEETASLKMLTEHDCYLDTEDADYLAAKQLLESRLESECLKADTLLKDIESIDAELQALDRKLAAVPDDAAVAEVQRRRQEVHHEQAVLEGKIAQIDESRRIAAVRLDEAERAYHKHMVKVLGGAQDQADNARVLDHAERVRNTLVELRRRLVVRRLGSLEEVIQESYGQLMRKQGMVRSVAINPDSYELILRNDAGNEIMPDWLSAGERQLLVVAILWGLARASSRSLPVIIDTPLSRLDSTHRDNLVRFYFPNASHQVVLLSTDEEIVGRTLQVLSPSVGHRYRLVYDDKQDATTIESGYFKERAHAN